jgi:hypothetical protein
MRFWDFLLGYPKTKKFRDFQGSLINYVEKKFMAVFEYIGPFFFQSDIFKLQEVFSEHGIRVFLEKRLICFQTFLILKIWDKPEVLKRFQKQFWKLVQKPKKPRIFWFRKIPCGLFPKPFKEGIFNVFGIFIEDYLKNLTCWKKSPNRFGLSAPKLSKNCCVLSTHKHLLSSDLIKLE